ncbi:unnamed protein product [Rhizophagus irregularis]|uniref:Uncharacterized protein n=1 Tax=Rhizophagus irregularis TaxID=588596 RepID=A0A916EJ65_9GLOM|nr:unnamed protein product [Rhizophagus irregularis]CAB5123741.1 unnamed protein product [Rhizophagus irregularis]CAB5395056.1 unnamed protein product [Rhizophagus irregularis]
MTLTRAQRAKNMRSLKEYVSSQGSSNVNTIKRSSEKAAGANDKLKQRRTRSGRKVADYYEPTSGSSEDYDSNYLTLDVDDQNKNPKESITAIVNQKGIVEKFHEDFEDTLNSGHSSGINRSYFISISLRFQKNIKLILFTESEQVNLQKRLGFPIFTKKFLNYDRSKRTQQQKLEQENKLTSIEIDDLREKIQELKAKSEKTLKESDEIQRLNNELTEYIEKIKSSLIQLEREIGPTVRSSGVKLDDTENMVAYINDFRKRIVSGCLLQPE